MDTAEALVRAAARFTAEVDTLRFGAPVAVVYNPLRYARASHVAYLRRYGGSGRRVVFLGMNPGPWGMAQTGVPFGDVVTVKEWLRIDEPVGRPSREHPARPVRGLQTTRVEVSGRRLWGLMRDRFGSAGSFFRAHFVANYCPLLFLDAGGRNLTPDRLRPGDAGPLVECCDTHLAKVLRILGPAWVVGVGRYASECARRVVASRGLRGMCVARIPHPSPASPAANRGWARDTERCLVDLGIWRRR